MNIVPLVAMLLVVAKSNYVVPNYIVLRLCLPRDATLFRYLEHTHIGSSCNTGRFIVAHVVSSFWG